MTASANAIRAGRAYVELFADDSRLIRGLQRAQRRLRTFGTTLSGMGGRLLTGGAAAALPFAGALRIFATFSDRMSEVRAITGANDADFQRLEETAKRLGRTTSFSASQAAEGMKFLGMAGFDTEQILAGLPAVLDLARAGAVELGIAADIASDVGSAFGMTADQIGHLSDVMAKTATSANTSIEMMGESFKFAAPVARAAGQSLEETAAALGLLGNNGIKASSAGTDVKNLLTVLAQNAENLGFGVSATDDVGNIRPLLDVMRELGQATRGLSQSERVAFFMDRFGKISGKSALILADAGGAVDDMRGKLDAADGSARKAAETMDDNLGGAFRSLMSAVEGVAISVGEALAPTITEWADSLRDAAQWVTRAVSRNREFVVGVVKAIAVVVAAGSALFALGILFAGVSSGVGAVITVFGFLGSAISALGALIGFLLSPLGLVAAAVVGLTAAWLTLTRSGARALGGLAAVLQGLKERAMATFQGIKDALAEGDFRLAAKILWLAIQAEWQRGINALNQMWIGAKSFFLDVWSNATANLAGIFVDAWAGLRSSWAETVGFLSDTWSLFIGGLQQAWISAQAVIARGVIQLQKLTGKLTETQAGALMAAVEIGTSVALDQAGKNTLQEIGDSDTSRRDQLSAIETDRQQQRAAIEQQRQADEDRRSSLFDAQIKASEEALEAASKEWQDAIDEAARQRQEAEGGDPAAGTTDSAAGRLNSLVEELMASGNGRAAGSVVGTFNALAIRGFSGDSVQDKIASATEETAKQAKKIAEQTEQGGVYN